MKTKLFILICSMTVLCSCRQGEKLTYPEAAKEAVVENYFDTAVADPYRWLENDTSAATAAWVEAENKITQAYLSKIPFREKLRQRLTGLINYERIGIPFKKNGKYYFSKNDGLQNQSVLFVADNADDVTAGRALPLLDPNKLSDDGTVALTGTSFSNNGKYMAFTISRSGSDWTEIFVLDLASKQLLDDHIVWAKFTGAAWQGDGFYYSAYSAPEEGKEYSNVNEGHKIFFHKIGDPQSADKLIFQNIAEPKRFYSASVDEDERLFFVHESGAGNGNNLFIKDLTKPNSPIVQLTSDMDYTYSPIELIGNKLYIFTNYGASKYRIMTADLANPKLGNWTELVPEKESVLSNAGIVGGKLILVYEKDVADHAYVYSTEGELLNEIALPTLGSVGFSGDKDDVETFYSFSSFTYPATIFKYDLEKNESKLFLAPKVAFNPDEYTTEQVFYPSIDGTKIPMFLTYKKGLKKDGKNPVLLYGYGGFAVSMNPGFSASRMALLEKGVIYAVANLRGGSEYGEEWHLAGTKLNKQNVFDDFIAAAEYLIKENYTNSGKIAINGGSNGGLLVGAVVNQRPELFKVAVPQVGVMDMLRYHTFTIGWNWAHDYGRSDDSPEMFQYLYAYSPLHNIKNDGEPYPAILITTADHDDRVVPAHSFKYAATLQASDTGDAPKIIRIDTKAGHGAGKPLNKQIEETADIYSFILYNLGVKY
ncbi:MAG: prolyl oligopeptidase family serine peptidase [Dysgonamonadaceae bacterium]|jgi:prolyl oligopeptidase|nr:prolyl oligopeptidase family serine peptidase [Dysgonamonadaceae bacterium]